MRKIFLFTIICLSWTGVMNSQDREYSTPILSIEKIEDDLFVHISYLQIENFGSFPCNGMVYFNGDEAIIFDTPTTDAASEDLINWIENEQQKTITAVVVTHFHIDCLGGIKEFNDRKIRTYASELTFRLAKEDSISNLPTNSFDKQLVLEVGNEKTITRFFGAGHTYDNVVSYIPAKDVLFGGCLVKELNAGKGNISDADIREWPGTVQKIKRSYPQLRVVIPGHGKAGGPELLDYTIELFEQE